MNHTIRINTIKSDSMSAIAVPPLIASTTAVIASTAKIVVSIINVIILYTSLIVSIIVVVFFANIKERAQYRAQSRFLDFTRVAMSS